MGDYPEVEAALTLSRHLRRWFFLLAKLVLLVSALLIASLFLFTMAEVSSPPAALYLELSFSFASLLFGFRWALKDQRRRCPCCLRTLTHPASVGHASRSFLAWSGTEMLCAGGHGFLYIPEHPTSWCSRQRWLATDPSWTALFCKSPSAAL